MNRSLVPLFVLSSSILACGSTPARQESPIVPSSTSSSSSASPPKGNGAPPKADGATPKANGATPKANGATSQAGPAGASPKAGGAAASGAGATTKGGVALVQLSSADPDCGLDGEGRPWRWATGQIERDAPTIKGAKAISCSATHTCVVAEDASVMCWGDNMYGALGDGTEKKPEGPVKVVGLASVAEIGVDFARSCARTTNGDVYCWGDREYGKAGDGTLDDKNRSKPLADKPLLTGATSLGVAMIHACASAADGSVTCWGQCRTGACGLPPRPPWIPRPMRSPKVTGAVTVFAGDDATCALDKAGGVSCWGISRYGVLGDAVTEKKAHDTPAKINLPGPAAEVAIGIGGHACARLTTGAVLCWGRNEHGQLGDGTTKDRPTPAPVKGIDKATRIAAGKESTCALVEGGRLFCWGEKRALKKPGAALEDAHEPVEIPPAPAGK